MSFDYFEDEFGKPLPKLKPKVVVKPVKKTFYDNVMKGRQSSNVIDNRENHPDYHRVRVKGYFTYNTPFHLAMNVPSNLANALKSQGFGVVYVGYSSRDKTNSQYNFDVITYVENRYKTTQVSASLANVLANTIAYPNSIRIMEAYIYE